MCNLVRERKCPPLYLFLLPISSTMLHCTEEAKYWSNLTVKGLLSINNGIQFSRRAKAGTFSPTIEMVSCSVHFNCYCMLLHQQTFIGEGKIGGVEPIWNYEKKKKKKEISCIFILASYSYTACVHLFLITLEPIDWSDPYLRGAKLPNQVYLICRYRKLHWGKRSC